jgi:exopolyphosphatase / guanosine-5'-triphosphate,3'-diphosphate pyrophosphatase
MSIRAALDIGSSSVKLLVLDLAPGGAYSVLAEEARVTGLGKGLAQTQRLSPAAMQATLECLREMTATARAHGAVEIIAAGTDALRRAQNQQEFLELVQAGLGLELKVLTGDEEAQISRTVALRELPAGVSAVVFFDVGGGSTELTWCQDGALRAAQSLGLGARRCTELAQVAHPVTASMRARLAELISGELNRHAPRPDTAPVTLAGLGGTASQLVFALRGRQDAAKGAAHGAVVPAGEVHSALEALARLSLEDVQQLKYMDPARAEIIFAGVFIIAELLRFYAAQQFRVIDRGLRYGLLLA